MANITLKDVNGNNIYPEVDVSTLSGTITENNEKFVIGGDVYSALSEKADISSIPKMDDYTLTTDSMGQWKVANPLPINDGSSYLKTSFLQSYKQDGGTLTGWYRFPGKDYCDETNQSFYVKHTITSSEKTAGKIKMTFLLDDMGRKVSNVRIIGDINGFRYMAGGTGSGQDITSAQVSHIDLYLVDNEGNKNTNEPIIRRIDSSEFSKSDRNVETGTSQACFHFSHLCSHSNSMQPINTTAVQLAVEFNLAQNTTLNDGDVIETFVSWVEF